LVLGFIKGKKNEFEITTSHLRIPMTQFDALKQESTHARTKSEFNLGLARGVRI
jgi:hypothetical protein